MANKRTKLTDSKIERLAPAPKGKRYEVSDDEVPMLVVRVTDKGHKSFLYKGVFPGRSMRTVKADIKKANKGNQVRRLIGIPGVLNVEQARDIARIWAALIREGKDPAEVQETAKAQAATVRNNTFGSVAEDWKTTHLAGQRRGAESWRMVDYDCREWWHRGMASITRDEVVALLKRVGVRAPYVAHNLAKAIQGLFSWALNEGSYGLEHHPMEHPRKIDVAKTIGKGRKARERELTDDEIFAYWHAAGELGYPYADFFRLLMLTAMRRNELSEAKRAEFDWEQGLYLLPSANFKGDRKHVHPLGSEAFGLLQALPVFKTHPKGYLFSTEYGAKPINSFGYMKCIALESRMLRILREKTGDPDYEMEQWGLHDLRRTCRTRLSMLGVDYVVAELCLEHKLRGMHAVYDRYQFVKERRRAFDLYARHVMSIVEGKPAWMPEDAPAYEPPREAAE
jgi:integrase